MRKIVAQRSEINAGKKPTQIPRRQRSRPPSSEQVAAFDRNEWPHSIGLPSRDHRNRQSLSLQVQDHRATPANGSNIGFPVTGAPWHSGSENRADKPGGAELNEGGI
jgi:hypothetical protein